MIMRCWLVWLLLGCCMGVWGEADTIVGVRMPRVDYVAEADGSLVVSHLANMGTYGFFPGEHDARFKVENRGKKSRNVTLRVVLCEHYLSPMELGIQKPMATGEVRDIRLEPGESRQVDVTIPFSFERRAMRVAEEGHSYMFYYALRSRTSLWENGKILWDSAKTPVQMRRGAEKEDTVPLNARCGRWVTPLFSDEICTEVLALKETGRRTRSQQLVNEGFSPFGTSQPVAQWPKAPRFYAGYSCIWMTDAEWQAAGEQVRHALEDYVHGGGTLLLCNPEKGRPSRVTSDEPRGLGRIIRLDGLEPLREELRQARFTGKEEKYRSGFASTESSFFGRALHWTTGDMEKAMLGRQGMSMEASAVALLILMLILGPGIYFWLKMRKRCILCLIVTPVASLGISVLLFAVMLCMEGCDTRSRVDSVVVWDAETGRLASHSLVSTFGIRAPKPLIVHSDERVELLDEAPATRTTALGSDTATYDGSLLKAYSPLQLVVRRWGREKTGLTCTRDSQGRLMLHNGFKVTLKDVALLGKDGQYYTCGQVKPGETLAMNQTQVSRLVRERGKLITWSVLAQGATVKFAETSALDVLLWSGHGGAGALVARTEENLLGENLVPADETTYRAVLVGRLAAGEAMR